MIGKIEKARVTFIKGARLQVYYQSTYWNAECVGGSCLSVDEEVAVVGGVRLPLQVAPLSA